MKTRNLTTLTLGFLFFVTLSGFRGCHVSSGETYYPDGTVVVEETIVTSGPGYAAPAVIYTGDLALTIYAPATSSITPLTETFSVTVREGGTFGPIVLQGHDYLFDAFGIGVIDIGNLPYGFYDIEVVGLDFFGNSVSYAALGVTVDEPLTTVTLDLEDVSFAGDVVLDIIAPDNGYYGNVDSIDYRLHEVDPATGELLFVEEIQNLTLDPWNSPVIGSLALGNYFIEVWAYDFYGNALYEFSGSFAHSADTTFLPVALWYL